PILTTLVVTLMVALLVCELPARESAVAITEGVVAVFFARLVVFFFARLVVVFLFWCLSIV
ncbi:hypothetical protein, partial [Staphylococcus aureus]|uniref:hypothetical protein n=1 Tax=Staphylococcus aureus TaxID=1280 RepID=UPI0035C80E92